MRLDQPQLALTRLELKLDLADEDGARAVEHAWVLAEDALDCEHELRRRVLDGSRAVLVGDLKLSLEAGERELWLIRMHSVALEERVAMVEVRGSIEEALREAKQVARA